ncbi:MAG: chromate resistance protein [Chloroflexi bacterium]|nr:chromate resistance protein [Chloroflexota bacterium]
MAFSYTLSAKKKSSARVALWRRLQRLGAISPVSGVYLLPATDACIESFQWLAQEVRQAAGQVIVMRVDGFDGWEHQSIVELFQTARKAEYAEVDQQVLKIESLLTAQPSAAAVGQAQDELAKLKRRYLEIVSIDYFDSYERATTAARLDKMARMLFPGASPAPAIPVLHMGEYQGKTWVTRPQPHVDRLACIWLIRRFIDGDAGIRYAAQVGADEIGFDMNDAHAAFGHNGNLCTFETLLKAFQIEAPGIETVAEIVHQIDLRDERFAHPEAIGIDAILRGWLLENLEDRELERRGLSLFDGIYQIVSTR